MSISYGMIIDSDSFSNNGSIIADGTATINTEDGGFSSLITSTLATGSYQVSGALHLNVGQQISSIAVPVTLSDNSTIYSVEPASGQAVTLQASLHTILPQGSLTLSTGSYTFGTLIDSGALNLGPAGDATLSSSNFTISASGSLTGTGTVASNVTNDGVIKVTPYHYNDLFPSPSGTLYLQGDVLGTGSLIIGAGQITTGFHTQVVNYPTLQLGGVTTENVTYEGNFGQLILDNPSSFSGVIAPSDIGPARSDAGDRIVLSNVSQSSITSTSYAGDSLGGTLTLNQATDVTQLRFSGNYTLNSFTLSENSAHATVITVNSGVGVACFASGTLIRTPDGDVPVENMKPGDKVLTTAGASRSIAWIGMRTLTAAENVAPRKWWPLRIEAHAFGPNAPESELLLSPGHCVCLDIMGELLIPIYQLLNGHSVSQVPVQSVTYWHIELASQDIVFANGLPCETYLETGYHRGMFENARGVAQWSSAADLPPSCRPRIDAGPIVEAARVRLDALSVSRGWTVTHDMNLHLMVDGARIEGDMDGSTIRFLFPASAKDVRMISEIFHPAQQRPDGDERYLGLPITNISFSDGLCDWQDLPLDHAALSDCHDVERVGECALRWTSGCQALPAYLWEGFRSYVLLRIKYLPNVATQWIAPDRSEVNVIPNNVIALRRRFT